MRREHIKSSVLGNPLAEPVEVPGLGNAFYTNQYTRINASIYAEHFISWRMLVLTAGIMGHHNSDLQGFGIYPGIDVSYRFNDGYKLYLSANKTLRMPTFTDMFYRSPVNRGNTHLKPEEAVSIEGGVKFHNTFLKGNVTLFHRRGYNMIDWVKHPSPDTLIWRSMNHTEVNFTGIRSSLTLTPSKEGLFERIESVRLSYSFLQADMKSTTLLSKYTLDYLSNQFTAAVDARIARKLYYSGRLTWQDRNGSYNDALGQTVRYKPFWLFDSGLSWRENQFTLYAEASNILNSQWYDFGGIIQPGLWIRGGVTVSIDYKKEASLKK
jgi:iron complex outermembrane receptor protein